jgi:acyl-CoA thioesterase I
VFPDVASQYHVPLVPFMLQNVALDPQRMQQDGVHPNARGEPPVLETIWPQLLPLLKK